MRQQAVDEFIHTIYGAVLDVELWLPALSSLAALVDAPHASLVDCDFAAGVLYRLVLHGIDEDENQIYLEKFAAIDPRVPILLGNNTLAWLSDHDYFDDAFRKTDRFYREYLQPRGAGETLGLTCAREGSRIGTSTLIRNQAQGRFSPRAHRVLNVVTPHIDRAIKLSRRFTAIVSEAILGHAVLDALDEPLACVLPDGRLHRANRAFVQLLRSGHVLSDKQGSLRIEDPDIQRQFTRALRECCHLAEGGASSDPAAPFTLRVDQRTGPPVFVTVAPLADVQLKSWAGRPCALVRIDEPAREVAAELLIEALGLSPAEARLVSELCAGGTLALAAQRIGISLNTAKTELASAFSKTGTARQSELMALVAALPRGH
jgi:DNA-binding CsgD family transcriptional regulator